jgi:serine/threonine-protein kinase OSR1/STK39
VCRAQDYLAKTLLEGLPPLGERVKILRERELARRGAAVENDIKSQSECVLGSLLLPQLRALTRLCARRYVRGVSNWNFDIEDLKVCGPMAPRAMRRCGHGALQACA